MPFGIPEASYLMRVGGMRRMGFRRVVDLLATEGLKYKWREMRADYSSGYKMRVPRSRLTFLPKNRTPPYGMRTPPLQYITKKYRYTTAIRVYDYELGDYDVKYYKSAYNRLFTRGYEERKVTRRIERARPRYPWRIFTIKLEQVEDITKK